MSNIVRSFVTFLLVLGVWLPSSSAVGQDYKLVAVPDFQPYRLTEYEYRRLHELHTQDLSYTGPISQLVIFSSLAGLMAYEAIDPNLTAGFSSDPVKASLGFGALACSLFAVIGAHKLYTRVKSRREIRQLERKAVTYQLVQVTYVWD